MAKRFTISSVAAGPSLLTLSKAQTTSYPEAPTTGVIKHLREGRLVGALVSRLAYFVDLHDLQATTMCLSLQRQALILDRLPVGIGDPEPERNSHRSSPCDTRVTM